MIKSPAFQQQVRHASTKRKTTVTRSKLHKFLGPKNFKGLYKKNPLAFSPDYAKYDPSRNYISNYSSLTGRLINRDTLDLKRFEAESQRSNLGGALQPFPFNEFCKTNQAIPEVLKTNIIKEHSNGEPLQRISFKYGISLPRVEAVVKLGEIETEWVQQVSIFLTAIFS